MHWPQNEFIWHSESILHFEYFQVFSENTHLILQISQHIGLGFLIWEKKKNTDTVSSFSDKASTGAVEIYSQD